MRFLLPMTLGGAFLNPAIAENAPVPEQTKPKLMVRTYDLKPILGEKSATTKLADSDAIVRLILDTVTIGDLMPDTSGQQIIVRNESQLEVRATEKTHGEIKDLLESLKSLADLAVDIKATVIELNTADYKKLVKPYTDGDERLRNSPLIHFYSEQWLKAPQLKVLDKIIASGKILQFSEVRYANGIAATISARQSVQSFSLTSAKTDKTPRQTHFVKEGFKLTALPVVSADRRFVRMKLTERSTMVLGTKTFTVQGFGGAKGGEQVLGPDVADLGATGSTEVEDGGALLFRLAYAPKDRVWVVVVRPTIFIQAEEDALKEEVLKKEGKR